MTEALTAPEPGASRIIHLDIDPLAIGRNYKADVALVGDTRLTLRDLIADLKMLVAKPNQNSQRIRGIAKAIKDNESTVMPMMNSDARPIKPQRIMKEVTEVLTNKDIVVSDTGPRRRKTCNSGCCYRQKRISFHRTESLKAKLCPKAHLMRCRDLFGLFLLVWSN
jgi:thiamine pyrophosphate-dependent acetolactate synthase large subunit-like protein